MCVVTYIIIISSQSVSKSVGLLSICYRYCISISVRGAASARPVDRQTAILFVIFDEALLLLLLIMMMVMMIMMMMMMMMICTVFIISRSLKSRCWTPCGGLTPMTSFTSST